MTNIELLILFVAAIVAMCGLVLIWLLVDIKFNLDEIINKLNKVK